MQKYYIEASEIYRAFFAVEAESPVDALARFEDWKFSGDDIVFDELSNTDNVEAVARIMHDDEISWVGDVPTLTNEKYEEDL